MHNNELLTLTISLSLGLFFGILDRDFSVLHLSIAVLSLAIAVLDIILLGLVIDRRQNFL